MNDLLRQMETSAFHVMAGVIDGSPQENSPFVLRIGVKIGEETRPLVLIGSMHRSFNDGNCIVLVNADQQLEQEVKPACAYSKKLLKDIVRKRCDAMSMVNFVAGKTTTVFSYLARRNERC